MTASFSSGAHDATKQDAATAATDTELAAEAAARVAADAAKQDASTAATDSELSAGLAGKADLVHASRHAPNGADPVNFTSAGALGSIPTATAANAGLLYFATDDVGGTLYRSTGSAWVKAAPGATQPAGMAIGYQEFTSLADASGAQGTPTDLGYSLPVTVGAGAVKIEFRCDFIKCSAFLGGGILLYEDATAKGLLIPAFGSAFMPGTSWRRRNPSTGTHTYKLYGYTSDTGNSANWLKFTVGDGTGTNNGPAGVLITQL